MNETVQTWHRRLGHLNFDYLLKLRDGAAMGVSFQERGLSDCDICVMAKHCKNPFRASESRAKEILELVHSDLCYVGDNSIGGAKYFLTFIDDYTRMIFIYFLKLKTQVTEAFREFKALAENQSGKKIKSIRTDNGKGEYVKEEFISTIGQAGIHRELTVPHNPQQNGRAERANRIILEKVRCMLYDSGLGKEFWAEAALMACSVANCSPKRALNFVTPYELWYNAKPNLSSFRIFGSRCLAYQRMTGSKGKLNPRSMECVMMGMSPNHKAYRLWDPAKRRIFFSRDVVVREDDERRFSIMPMIDAPIQDETEEQTTVESEESEERVPDDSDSEILRDRMDVSSEHTSSDGSPEPQTVAPSTATGPSSNKRPKRLTRRPPANLEDFEVYAVTSHQESLNEPATFRKAIESPEADAWRDAMQREYNSIMRNETWTLIEPPPDANVIGCGWVYKKKVALDGTTTYRARLVARGYAQVQGSDYNKTYSPVVRMTTLRYLFAASVRLRFHLRHFDVESAYLHGLLEEDVYMRQPKGFEKGTPSMVCKLKKAIYGTKQGGRVWNQMLNEYLVSLGYSRTVNDNCLYFGVCKDHAIFVAVHVDDFFVFANPQSMIEALLQELSKKFAIKDLGETKRCLGINVTYLRDQGVLKLDQSDYAATILKRFNMQTCRPTDLPMDVEVCRRLLNEAQPENLMLTPESFDYMGFVGSLIYLGQATRLDLSYAVSFMGSFSTKFTAEHVTLAKSILKYLRGTTNAKMTYKRTGNKTPIGYTDASYLPSKIDTRSVSAYIFMHQGGPISWQTKKQATSATSACKAELLALSTASHEAI